MLTRESIAALIPHRGAMCLLHEVIRYDASGITCRAVNHRDFMHPLREAGALEWSTLRRPWPCMAH
jgi:predicted hotdog family 3-hydroxylacyl-ACP dehydratase